MIRVPNLAARPLLNDRPVWIATAVALALGLLLLGLNLHLYFSATHVTERLQARKAELEAEKSELVDTIQREKAVLDTVRWKKLNRRLERINVALAEHRFSWLRLLRDLGETLPWQVRLVKVQPMVSETGVTLQISGEAQTSEAVLELLQNLIDSSRFEKPLPRSEESPEVGKGTAYGFTLTVQYLPEEGS